MFVFLGAKGVMRTSQWLWDVNSRAGEGLFFGDTVAVFLDWASPLFLVASGV
jgi:hypothetical protein